MFGMKMMKGLHMPLDLFYVMIAVVGSVIGLIDGLRKYENWNHNNQSFHYLWKGLLLLFFGMIFNSLFEGRWDLNYLIAFLSLRKAGRLWLFRAIVSFAYAYIAMGIEILVIVAVKNYHSR